MGKSKELETEYAYFNEKRQEFFKRAPYKFVLIKGRKEYGFFDTGEQALNAGVDLFGLVAFFIAEVLPEEPIWDIPALRLGLINART